MRDGAIGYSTDYYVYEENGELQKIRYEYEDYKALIKKTYDLIDGEWKLTGEEGLDPMKGQESTYGSCVKVLTFYGKSIIMDKNKQERKYKSWKRKTLIGRI